MEEFQMDQRSYWYPTDKKRFQHFVTTAVTTAVRAEEKEKAANENAKFAQEYALKEKALKRKAAEKDDIISYLMPPKSAKNDYIEQKPAKYVFKCMDGDIQIPEYGIFRTDFYNKERINHLD